MIIKVKYSGNQKNCGIGSWLFNQHETQKLCSVHRPLSLNE